MPHFDREKGKTCRKDDSSETLPSRRKLKDRNLQIFFSHILWPHLFSCPFSRPEYPLSLCLSYQKWKDTADVGESGRRLGVGSWTSVVLIFKGNFQIIEEGALFIFTFSFAFVQTRFILSFLHALFNAKRTDLENSKFTNVQPLLSKYLKSCCLNSDHPLILTKKNLQFLVMGNDFYQSFYSSLNVAGVCCLKYSFFGYLSVFHLAVICSE